MSSRTRNLGRVAVAGLLTAGALTVGATPAFAAGVDLGVEVAGSTIAVDTFGKSARLELTNNGSVKPTSVVVVIDATKLDSTKVKLDSGCPTVNNVATCTVSPLGIPAPGGTAEFTIPLTNVAGKTGAAGKLTVTVKAPGDTDASNDSRTVDVAIGSSGPDLSVDAFDVTWKDGNGSLTDEPVPPGETGQLVALVLNQGDQPASGLRVKIQLPAKTSFPDHDYEGCVFGADNRTAECDLSRITLQPQEPQGGLNPSSALLMYFDVKVAADTEGPATLTGGAVAAAATARPALARRSLVTELPDFAKWATAEDVKDVDLSDNTDAFAVFVDASTITDSPSPSTSPSTGASSRPAAGTDGQAGTGGQGGGGGLPVTGPAGYAIGSAGLLVIAAGVGLLLVTRRRRRRFVA